MEDCLGLEDPFLFFVQLSHSVIKVAPSITRLTNLYVISPPTPFPKMLGFFLSVFILLHTVKSFSSLANITSTDELSLMYLHACEPPCAPIFALSSGNSQQYAPASPLLRISVGVMNRSIIVLTVLSSPENPNLFFFKFLFS